MSVTELHSALQLRPGESPFPWQADLVASFVRSLGERISLDIPTGLGKTSVMAAWLVARAKGAQLPRRLVYVVDRRAVVDQATTEAERLRDWVGETPPVRRALRLSDDQQLAISTLRGHHADNREWLSDPAAPAIIVGTVDMIGSRLLFEGYGVSRKMRPYHAGLLGSDTLFVLDEAHLVPPFEKLLETLVCDDHVVGRSDGGTEIVPKINLISLSATGRSFEGEVIRLSDADLEHPVVRKRLNAPKRLSFVESDGATPLPELLAEQAWGLADRGQSNVRVIVFSNSRDVADKALTAIQKLASGKGKQKVEIDTELFVGSRRVRERTLASDWLQERGFLAGSEERPVRPAFVFATSAGEVGVDLDADHMVCDLVQWERMVQRLGRVNRRGDGDAQVRVIVERVSPASATQKALQKPEGERTAAESKKVDEFTAAVEQAKADERGAINVHMRPFLFLPKDDTCRDASPGAIRLLKSKADGNPEIAAAIAGATSSAPLRPALTRAVVDAWSMTSLERHTGRPVVSPWLRGWVGEEPQTTVVWRRWLPVCIGSKASDKKREADAEAFFEQAPPHLSEQLEARSSAVHDWLINSGKVFLKALAKTEPNGDHNMPEDQPILQRDSTIGVILTQSMDVVRILTLGDIDFDGDDKKEHKRRKDALRIALYDNLLVVCREIEGLNENGLLDDKTKHSQTVTGDDEAWEETGFRVRSVKADDGTAATEDTGWRTCFRFVSQVATGGESEGEPQAWLLVEKRIQSASSEDSRAISHSPQSLADHRAWAVAEADYLSRQLELPEQYSHMLRIAARLHDEGKSSDRWQNAFSAPVEGRPYAKTCGPVKPRLLDGYRHEFGSLRHVESDDEFKALSPDLQDLALHMVAAHHGSARPLIRMDACDDAPPSALEERARDVALRFVRLQRRWGPWRLAWWESLLRAADQRASRRLDLANANHETEATHG
ncbi:MAG: type I-U CRISPR-associated helicase/endonuclease Cas3 [Planctomycetaceae bacterium]|nr:type I-U CRISPR-associated helicase/endonuclease Cas3 [Planctomycetaceae bacterium]